MREETGKQKRDTMSRETKVYETHNPNKSVRQRHYQEVPDHVTGSSEESSEESEHKTRTNNIAIEVNAQISQEEQDKCVAQRVPLIDLKTQEIALKIKINGKFIKTILDTGSQVTVISRKVYDAMDREFEEEGTIVSSAIRKSKLKLFSCKRDHAVAISGECDVKLEKDEFKCITPVIVAKGLAHECLIGMNVLVRWPILKEAISALLKKQPVVGEENRRLSKIPLIARLNNIGLPQIIADNEFKNKLLLKQTLVREGRKVTQSETEHNESSLELRAPGRRGGVQCELYARKSWCQMH